MLGRALRAAGRPAEALVAAQGAVAADPGSASAHAVHALSLMDLDRNREATAAMWRAIRLEPESARHRANLSTICLRHNDDTAALAAAARAVSLDGSSAYGHLMYAIALERSDRGAEAQKSVREAIRLDPNLAPAHALQAELMARRGDVSDAAASVRRLAGADPRHPLTRWSVSALLEALAVHLRRGGLAMLLLSWATTGVLLSAPGSLMPVARGAGLLSVTGLLASRVWRVRANLRAIWRFAVVRVPHDPVLAFEAALVAGLYLMSSALWCIPALDTLAVGGWIVLVLVVAVLASRPIRAVWIRRIDPGNQPRG